MRDLPASLDLLTLARELLLDGLAPLLPPERRRDAHLVATVIAIASREVAGEGWPGEFEEALSEFYGEEAPAPTPSSLRGRDLQALASDSSPASAGGLGWGFGEALHRFAADLRNGAFETSPSRAAAARAILWRLTIENLGEGNPQFLAANGFRKADR